jgi:hypothetical protein
MKAFRIGFIATLSFFIVVGIFSATLGYYPPPKGEKMPEYPTMGKYDYNDPDGYKKASDEYQKKSDKYSEDLEKYQEDQKSFVKKKIVPYARNVFVGWVLSIALIEIIGLVVSAAGYQLAGGGWAFAGFWTIFLGPLGSILWYVNTLISSFARQADQDFSTDPILQALAITCFVAVLLMTGVAIFLERTKRPFVA